MKKSMIAQFRTVNLEDATTVPEGLREQLEQVRHVLADREKKKLSSNLWLALATLAAPVLLGIWVALDVWMAYKDTGWDFSFLWSTPAMGLPVVFIALIAAVIVFAAGELLTFLGAIEDHNLDYFSGFIILAGVVALLAGVFAFLPYLPFLYMFGVLIAFLTNEFKIDNMHREERFDKRFAEYNVLIDEIEDWNDSADHLNDLRLKVEHGLFEEEFEQTAIDAIEAMRADREALERRIEFASELASQGSLGSRPSHGTAGEFLVHRIADRSDDRNERQERLREVDKKAIAAMQVRKNKW
ncbi:MAG: hypothetical protein Q8P30_00610 [Candidatus Uhrbacteria bacterium]|nr:hypothetical protein [Candidatus Uhrbacteria bacterium]